MNSVIASGGKSSKHKGFTLVELLVVMALIGVLATAITSLVNPIGQFRKVRDTQRKNDLSQIQRALEQYYNDFGRYPQHSDTTNYYILSPTTQWGQPWTPYMDIIPKDPTAVQRYRYISPNADGQSYMLYAHLENNVDAQLCVPGSPGTACPGAGSVTCGGPTLICNYGVSSPNVSP
jgi:general secretion pathway protein G